MSDTSRMESPDIQSSAHSEMSVVLVTPDDYGTIRRITRHLLRQTVRDRLEIVIVAPSADRLGLDEEELSPFPGVLVVEVGPIASTARARGAGVRQATAPLVAFAEDHSYPEPGWAEALIKAHAQPWAVVGPVVGNANPNTTLSWASLIIEYAPWLDPTPASTVDQLPGHQSSYKRAILLDCGAELEDLLEAESVLHWNLRSRRLGLYLEPSAKTNHLNIASPVPWLKLRYYSGRGFAAARSRRWSIPRRLAYASGAPLIPLVRLWRILRKLCRSREHLALLRRVLPALAVGLALSAVGEAAGYAAGAGDCRLKLADLEFRHNRRLADGNGQAVLEA